MLKIVCVYTVAMYSVYLPGVVSFKNSGLGHVYICMIIDGITLWSKTTAITETLLSHGMAQAIYMRKSHVNKATTCDQWQAQNPHGAPPYISSYSV